jgi:glycosyltransferase involved in cell wall biosynthesis
MYEKVDPMISVVIPCYNEEKLITKCLDALVSQQTSQQFEVILVNNNSTDRTIDIAKTYKNKLDLTIVLEKQKGRGAARKKGFQEAKGDIILSTDADSVVPPAWIDQLTNVLKKSDAVAVTGTCRITGCERLNTLIFNFSFPLFMRIYKLVFGHYWLSGFNFGIYKKAYEKAGGFNPRLNFQEDMDLSFKVSRIGGIKLISHTPVLFSGRRFQKGLLKGGLPYMTTFVRFFLFKKDDVILSDIR